MLYTDLTVQAARYFDQDCIPRGVPEDVVDLLETVEIRAEEGSLAPRDCDGAEFAFDGLLKEPPIR